jgi:glycine cleavage system H protein
MNIPSDLKYAETHEWARAGKAKDKDIVAVGISDYAQEELTDIVYVDLPKVGDEVEAGTDCAVVESVKAASDIYSPVTGKVVEINQAIVDNPSLVNEDPYGKGWFFKVKIKDPAELDDLMSDTDYEEHLAEIAEDGGEEDEEDEK